MLGKGFLKIKELIYKYMDGKQDLKVSLTPDPIEHPTWKDD